jgi:hypothetical protein
MDTNSVGRVDDYVPPVAPPPSPKEQERAVEAEAPAPEPREDTGTRVDLFA